MQNKFNLQITAADEAAIKTAIDTVAAKLTPHLLTLTDAERKGGLKWAMVM